MCEYVPDCLCFRPLDNAYQLDHLLVCVCLCPHAHAHICVCASEYMLPAGVFSCEYTFERISVYI